MYKRYRLMTLSNVSVVNEDYFELIPNILDTYGTFVPIHFD